MTVTELPVFSSNDGLASNRIVILGAGYGGLRCAQMLSKYLDEPDAPEVVLVDRYSYHQIITELPVAASGRAEPEDVSMPLDQLLTHAKVRVEQAEVLRIDVGAKVVITTRRNLSFGVLVVAVGSITAFYGVPGLAEHALTLKSIEDAENINSRVREMVATAAGATGPADRTPLLSFLIGGAGLTGVELAGELAEFLPSLLKQHDIAPTEARVVLVEAAPHILPIMPPRLQSKGAAILADLGVRLMLGSKVIAADGKGIALASGDRLVGRTLVWTGGIMAPPLLAQSGIPTAHNGQAIVDEYLRVPDLPFIYVVGDAALIQDASGHGVLEPTAQVAVKQAEAAAYNIVAGWTGRQARPYVAVSKGQVVSLGPTRGVASIFHVSLTGRKVIALKALVEEGYRYSVTGKIRLGRPAASQPAV